VIKKQLISAINGSENRKRAENILQEIDVHKKGDTFILTFPHKFSLEMFENKYLPEIKENIAYNLQLNIRQNSGEKTNGSPAGTNAAKKPFGREYTFENFLHNKKNYFPWISAKEIAEKNNTEFNPFVIFGMNSTGKTHLLRSIANYLVLEKKIDQGGIFLANTENLNNICKNKNESRESITSKDYLFIDDVHQLLHYESLQKELILIFDHFHEQKKQMIFCFTGALSLLDSLNPNLKSRLEWGLLVRVKKPDMDIRIRYIKQKCQEKRLHLSNEQILTIAEKFENIRTIQGIILKLFAFHKLVTPQLSAHDFQSILSSLDNGNNKKSVDFEELVQLVCEEMDITPQEMLSKNRKKKAVMSRQICMYLARQFLPLSYPEIGKKFGNRDHSTVIYSVKKIEKIKEHNQETNNLLKNMIAKCHSMVHE
jgi:chromosomal replication initiator protein